MTISTATVPLHHVESGNGPPLVVLHGLFGSVRNWQTIARRLSATHRVICADLRNHGRSPHVTDMRYTSMATDVDRLADELDLVQPALLGHSMGGKVAMTSALRDPSRWARLIVVDIAPVRYSNSFLTRVEAMLAMPVESFHRRADADTFLREVEPDPAVRNFLLHNLQAHDGHYRWQINLEAIRDSLPEIAGFPDLNGPCMVPTLAIRGDRSGAVRPDFQPRLRELFPNAQILTLASGHWPHAEVPEAFLEAVSGFLDNPD